MTTDTSVQGADRLVLIVDDEASIRRTLEGVFSDVGFSVMVAEDGVSALHLLKDHRPDIVLLDIWMPGLDGLETLQQIKAQYPGLPVIMISGHATIATAVKATRMGAFDFIEKPLDLNLTIEAVRRALAQEAPGGQPRADAAAHPDARGPLSVRKEGETPLVDPVVFRSQRLRGAALPQRTLAGATVLYGQGLHSGRKSGLILEPLPPNSGVHFCGIPETTIVPAHIDYVESTGFATTLRLGETQVTTIEHMMSCLHAYGISNLLVKCNGEVPVMDGSAREFCSLIEEAGIKEQDGEWYEIKVDRVYEVGTSGEYLRVEPADQFIVDYTLDYPPPLGRQHLVFALGDGPSYKKEIAPARTFGFVRDVGMLQSQGLAQGGRFDNFVLYGDEGPINSELRFSDEAVRHKILDAIGDLYLLGRPIRGRVTARMTGHSDNVALLKLLREAIR